MEEEDGVAQAEAPPRVMEAYRRYRDDLVRFATVLVGPSDAQDVVSSAMLRLLDRPDSSVKQPRPYLYQTVANQARNHKRGEARRRSRELRVAPTDRVPALPEPYPEVREAIERLSVRQRAVVYLAYWEDLTEEAIAEHLGIGAGSVRTHLARARRHLRKALDDYDR
jgi:RNA polymerase sigma factor (sigma-70 family)